MIRPEIQRIRERIPAVIVDGMRECTAGRKPWPLFIFGGPGSGKTCSALYLADRVMPVRRGCSPSVWFCDFGDLCEEVQKAKLGTLEWGILKVQTAEVWAKWAGKSLCVLDEIGARSQAKDHPYECIKKAIDTREGRPLVVISNIVLDEIGRVYDDRIASRLAGGTVVDAGQDDQRLVQF